MLPAFKVPEPTAKVLIKFVAALGIVMAPETFSVIPELIFNVFVVAISSGKVIDPQAASAVTVTVNPRSILTKSPACG